MVVPEFFVLRLVSGDLCVVTVAVLTLRGCRGVVVNGSSEINLN